MLQGGRDHGSTAHQGTKARGRSAQGWKSERVVSGTARQYVDPVLQEAKEETRKDHLSSVLNATRTRRDRKRKNRGGQPCSSAKEGSTHGKLEFVGAF